MGVPEPLVSPVTWSSPDTAGKSITVTFVFDNVTLILSAVAVTRMPGCPFKNIYFGLGADGTPDTTATVFANITAGNAVTILPGVLTSYGFTTITDVLNSAQITAGP